MRRNLFPSWLRIKFGPRNCGGVCSSSIWYAISYGRSDAHMHMASKSLSSIPRAFLGQLYCTCMTQLTFLLHRLDLHYRRLKTLVLRLGISIIGVSTSIHNRLSTASHLSRPTTLINGVPRLGCRPRAFRPIFRRRITRHPHTLMSRKDLSSAWRLQTAAFDIGPLVHS